MVLVPGLGLPGYLRRLVPLLAAWTRVTVLDVPGFGRPGPLVCAPTVPAMAATVAEWLRSRPGPVLLAGHSTGAQAALRAAVEVPAPLAGLVLVGPTFAPGCRTVPGLLRAVPGSYARDAPSQVPYALPDLARARARLVPMVLSAMADRPEELVPRVGVPLVAAAGAGDRFCPRPWLEQLAALAPRGRAATLPGSHNVPYTHAGSVAALLREVTAPSAPR
ncbi:alpha/beta fold hydrolase [Vallicoccus soli]|uniref:alpha/beta fold hydrolase n=1 Tax=Vallicoccus soli TaxID=2339232 RepID=UPI0014033BC8|nr:alpha/beta hydrolase [Vallicoccus soli]